jgi:hypothetical protein
LSTLAEITSATDVAGGLIGVAIGVLVVVYRGDLARWAAQGFQMGGSEESLTRVYAVLGALAILIAIASVFLL